MIADGECFAVLAPPKPEPEFHDSLEWDELVAERDQWKAQCEAWAAKATEWTLERDSIAAALLHRAEKAEAALEHLKDAHLDERTRVVDKFRRDEADLAAARACIRWMGSGEGATGKEFRQHLDAIAAARGQPPSGDKCAVCGADPCKCGWEKTDDQA